MRVKELTSRDLDMGDILLNPALFRALVPDSSCSSPGHLFASP